MVRELIALFFAAALTAGLSADGSSRQAVGNVEGRVGLEEPPGLRRSAPRYPGRSIGVNGVQSLPVIAYIKGPLPGDPPATSTMMQRDTAFSPPMVIVRAGGSVAFPNGDPFFHNVFSYSSAQRFDLGRYPQGESKSVAFGEPGIIEVFCEVHEFMRGAILVAENPFTAIVGADGSFRIVGVPEGRHTIVFWHPDHRPVERSIVVTAGTSTRVEVDLQR